MAWVASKWSRISAAPLKKTAQVVGRGREGRWINQNQTLGRGGVKQGKGWEERERWVCICLHRKMERERERAQQSKAKAHSVFSFSLPSLLPVFFFFLSSMFFFFLFSPLFSFPMSILPLSSTFAQFKLGLFFILI